jgi:L-seryl-tRNA(Ser) seleniumtransferase
MKKKKLSENQQILLRKLPGVDHILERVRLDPLLDNIPKSVLVNTVRSTVADLRAAILDGERQIGEEGLADSKVVEKVKARIEQAMAPNLCRTINATGVIVHTNLGRSILAAEAVENLNVIASRYSNLEFDLSKGKRGSRYSAVEDILCEITGAEAALTVNNNAGAVFLCLETIASGKTVIVSRGELVEIGGSFRIPDVMAKSGGRLKEVGTTNRTHVSDYVNAVDQDCGLLLKVHTSNYSVVGFTAEVSLKELVEVGQKYNLTVMEDLGSGNFIDFSKYNLSNEPTVQASVAAGADIITFSADKLLGGPQAGIILGKKDILDTIKKNPLTRALRIDKLTLAALESTLRIYRDPERAIHTIPTLRMLTLPKGTIENKAKHLEKSLQHLADPRLDIQLLDRSSKSGGGALPLLELPSKCVGIKIDGISANAIESHLRERKPAIIGRIEEDMFIMDLRTIQDDELSIIEAAFDHLLKGK